jgi:hypothetical protein
VECVAFAVKNCVAANLWHDFFYAVAHIKKTVNISTVRATPETRKKLEDAVKCLGFRSIAHFFTRSMETLLEQVERGECLRWPLRFECSSNSNRIPARTKRTGAVSTMR